MSDYKYHPAVKDLRSKYFNYSWEMFPFQFKDYYNWCPVHIPGAPPAFVNITRYQAGLSAAANQERGRWRAHVRAHYGAAIAAPLKSWLGSSREGAVFGGHGLPEEISLVCSVALASGYVAPGNLVDWAYKWIGLDCNGFVSAYFASLGTFSRPLHSHIHYPVVTKVATTMAEISYDSVLLWAKEKDSGGGYEVIRNPGSSAHIAVVDGWATKNSSLWVSERGGNYRFSGHSGIHTGIYDINKSPKAGAKFENAVWHVKAREKKGSNEIVFITREMQSY